MFVGEMVRSASVMRSALVGRPTVVFDAPGLVGPLPSEGRIVEAVEVVGRHVEIMWDDGIILDTAMRSPVASHPAEWHVYRTGAPWRRSAKSMSATIGNDDFIAVCFDASSVETYRQPDPHRHPGFGPPGPDVSQPDADVDLAVERLLTYHNWSAEPDAFVRDAIVDQRVMRDIGNVYRCEMLWAAALSPWAHTADLTIDDAVLLVNTATRLLRQSRGMPRRVAVCEPSSALAVYGRTGQPCIRCQDPIENRTFRRNGRVLYWCPGCQVGHDRAAALGSDSGEISMDPHPAATKFLSDLPWRRTD